MKGRADPHRLNGYIRWIFEQFEDLSYDKKLGFF